MCQRSTPGIKREPHHRHPGSPIPDHERGDTRVLVKRNDRKDYEKEQWDHLETKYNEYRYQGQ